MDYTSQGYDIFLQKEPLTPQSGQRELTELEFGVQNQVISASGITAGLQKSTSGKLQLDWDNGVMTIIFPQGFMKIGSVGKDNNGNVLTRFS